MRRSSLLLAALLAALSGCAEFRARFPGPDVLFIATPSDVGIEMLRLASVSAQDVVFDLGSGDGRVVITAAREFGARGVGVEIDPELVKTSRDAAFGAGVVDRTTFLWQDLFVTDLRTASVVTLYLRDDVNLRLRPKLLSELDPGSRVVSHDFDMGDWRPDRTRRVRGPSREHRLYLWLIPAHVAGVWRMRVGEREALLDLTQHYQVLGGTLTLEGRELALTDGKVTGDQVAFTAGAVAYTGRARGDSIEGRAGERAAATSLDWSCHRVR